MSFLPWEGNYSGTKRSAREPADQRLPKLRKETASLFLHGDGSDDGGRDVVLGDTAVGRLAQDSAERVHDFHGTVLRTREFPSHMLNGSVLLDGSFAFDKWLVQNRSILDGRRVLELKSGMGALAIFLRKALGVDITTSDFDDKEIEYSIAYNCRINNLAALPHIRHTWGDPFPVSKPDWDIVIACDIEPYVEQSTNLVKTLCFLLREYKQKGQRAGCTAITNKSGTQVPVRFPIALISWRRRSDPSVLFLGCEKEGLEVQHLGCLVYLIKTKN
ncbi:uncharacterized protein LOC133913691 [Phragmites australis]|uniref:uncharacterized protein LOC133913691 n=1 Tax=Phragmites australis TaxID=29695 RepID=UPI002D7895C1|nr:uncharacterized protein LOC133913691 [Phragmites australis]